MIKKYYIIFIVFAFFTLLFFRINRFVWEDGIVEPWFVTHGLMFSQDFYSTYLPLPKIIMIPINILSNWNLATTPVLGFAMVLFTVLLIYFIAREVSNKKFANLAVLYFSVWYMFILQQNTLDVNLLIGFLILLAYFIYIKWIDKQNFKNTFLFSLVGTAAVFTIQHSAISVGIIFLAMCAFILFKDRNMKAFRRLVIPCFLGFGSIVFPILIWFALRGALDDFYFWSIDYYFRDTGYPFSKLGFSPQDLNFLIVFLAPLVFSFVVIIAKKKWKSIPLMLMLIASALYILFAIFHPRRVMFMLPIQSVFIGFVFYEVFEVQKRKLSRFIALIYIGIFLIYFLGTIMPWYKDKISVGTKVNYYNVVQPFDPDYMAVEWVKKNTTKDSTLFVLAGNTLNFFETERLPANRWTYAIPWVYEPFEMMKDDLENRPADYFIVDERLLVRFNNWKYPHQVNYINEYLLRRYRLTEAFDWMKVYKLKSE